MTFSFENDWISVINYQGWIIQVLLTQLNYTMNESKLLIVIFDFLLPQLN